MTIETKFNVGDGIAYINRERRIAEGVIDSIQVYSFTDRPRVVNYYIGDVLIPEEDAWPSRDALLEHLTTPY